MRFPDYFTQHSTRKPLAKALILAVVTCLANLTVRADTARPELALQLGHSQSVRSLAYSPDGRLLATAGGDGLVKLWDAASRDLIRSLAGHFGGVLTVAFAPDGQTLASGDAGGFVIVWDARTGRILRRLPRQQFKVFALCYSPDGKTLATGSSANAATVTEGELKLWDPATGRLKSSTSQQFGFSSVAFSPDGKLLATGNSDSTVRLWDANNLTPRQTLQGHTGYVSSVAFAPNGQTLASGSWDKTVQLWDLATAKSRGVLPIHTEPIHALAFSSDGHTLASGGDTQVRLWDTDSDSGRPPLPAGMAPAWSLAFAPGTNTLAGSDGATVKFWNTGKGELEGQIESRARYVNSIAYSPDGKLLASAGNLGDTIQIWNTQSGALKQTLTGHRGRIATLAFAPNGKLLASAGDKEQAGDNQSEVTLWNIADGTVKRRIAAHRRGMVSLAFSPDGKLLATGSQQFNTSSSTRSNEEIKLWNVATGGLVHTWSEKAGTARSLTFSPDGRLIASAHWWIENPKPVKTLAEARRQRRIVRAEVRLRDAHSGKLLRTFGGIPEPIKTIAFAPDGKTLAAGASDAKVRLWDVATGRQLRVITGHQGAVQAVDFAADNVALATAGDDNTVRIWDRRNGQLLRTMRGHEFGIRAMQFAPDGKRLATAGIDTTIRIWDKSGGRELARLLTLPAEDGSELSDSANAWLAVTPEGYYHCSEGVDYIVKWRFRDRLVPFYQFEEAYRRPDMLRQALRGERITLRPLTLNRVAPVAWILKPVDGQTVSEDSVRILIGALDDSAEPMQVRISVNGISVPDELAKAITADAKPIPADGKGPFEYLAITADGKPITTDGKSPFLQARSADGRAKPITTDGKPITTDGKPITTDGKPITTDGKPLPAEFTHSHLFMTDVQLPPGQETVVLRVSVLDSERNRFDETITIRHNNTAPVKGDLHLLSVGIGQYRNQIYNLKYAAADAAALADVLRLQQGLGYDKVHITQLTDRQATRKAILEALAALKKNVKPADTVMIFFSGHGLQSKGRFYFAPWGTFVNDIAGTCVEWQHIVSSLSAIYGKKLLFSDACHSGARLGAMQATNEQLTQATRQSGIVMFSSSQGNEFSFEEPSLKHGAFSMALTEAFAGKADVDGNGAMTLPELALYVPRRVSSLTRGLQNPQLVLVQDFDPQTIISKIP